MTTKSKIVWTKRKSKKAVDPKLLARRIDKTWLSTSPDMVTVTFGGTLQAALMDLRDAAKQLKKNLPIGSLRLMLQAHIDGVVSVDKDLGCDPTRKATPALMMYRDSDEDHQVIERILDCLNQWSIETLDFWAKPNGLGTPALRVKRSIAADCILLTGTTQPLVDSATGVPQFALIVRQICDRLAGETLFPGMGPCELVLPEFAAPNTLELMTLPKRAAQGNTSFSMVARVSVGTVPYSDELYLTLSAAKRVWAEKMPDGSNTGSRATAYVIAPNRPTVPVGVSRRKVNDIWTWGFDDEYAALCNSPGNTLPATLENAMKHIAFTDGQWWAGLPQTTRLYRRVASRTVFEGDELDLMLIAEPKLAGIIDGEVPFAVRSLRLNSKPRSAMLRAGDFGVAGICIAEDEEGEDGEGGDDNMSPDGEREAVVKFREQCSHVLEQIHDQAKPRLWIVGGEEIEQRYIEKAAELLFGDAVEVKKDPLPKDVHGLRADLPDSDLKARQRFESRVRAWVNSGLPEGIALYKGPKFVLICAAKDINRRSEDTVNRRAAIHVMCSLARASVHHVLPIEATSTEQAAGRATQAFIHRAQSAMMDVMLAHSGYILGAGEFVRGQLPEGAAPNAVYGIQALRRNAQRFTGETAICLVSYFRLSLASNVTEVSFGYKEGGKTSRSPWMRLADGLIWLGCQRQMQGDEEWLKREFQRLTLETLQEIGTQDPRAILFIDWQTLPALWSDLSDARLTKTPGVHLGHVNLSDAFPKMSFVRLRHGPAAAMPLRAWSETVFEAIREDAANAFTGEFSPDAYATTRKQLVELNPDAPKGIHAYGHFVGVMGYRKTTQTLRGLSCYRTMSRKVQVKDAPKGVFEERPILPAEIDASLPASIDITVMHCPEAVKPSEVASIAMGLRLGYAHYDDWTRLPAPLFFGRKIDDYIIKYPASEEDEAEGGAEPTPALPVPDEGDDGTVIGDGSVPIMQVVGELVEKEVNPAPAKSDAEAEETEKRCPEEEDGAGGRATSVACLVVPPAAKSREGLSLIEQAQQINVEDFLIYSHPKRSKIFRAIVQREFVVRVEPPYFVEFKGFFGKYEPVMKHRIRRSYQVLQDLGYVKRVGERRPPFEQYLDWIAGFLWHPQGASVIGSGTLDNNDALIPAVQRIINRYNATAEQPLPLREFERTTKINLKPLVDFVTEQNDDEALGWLIFTAAQTPAYGCAESIISNLTRVLGQHSEAALHYYIDCADACMQVIARHEEKRMDRLDRFDAIIKKRVFVPSSESPITSSFATNLIQQDTQKQPEDAETTRSAIVALVQSMVPGSDEFQDALHRLQELIQAWDRDDQQLRQAAEMNATMTQIVAACRAKAEGLIAIMAEIDNEGFLGVVRYEDPSLDDRDIAARELDTIEALTVNASTAKRDAHAFDETPVSIKSLTTSERRLRAQQADRLYAAVEEQFSLLLNALLASRHFILDGGGNGPDGGKNIENEIPTLAPVATLEAANVAPAAVPAKDDTLVLDALVIEPESAYEPEAAPQAVQLEEALQPEAVAAKVAESEVKEAEPIGKLVPEIETAFKAAPKAESPLLPVESVPLPEEKEKVVKVTSELASSAQLPQFQPELPGILEDRRVNEDFQKLMPIIAKRHYSLGSVYVAAIRNSISDPVVGSHCTILSALCNTMESIDCQFAIDTRIDVDLHDWLQNHTLESDSYASNICQGLGILAAGLVSTLFSGWASDTNDVRWTIIDAIKHPLTGVKEISDLVDHIASIDSKRVTLTREKFAVRGMSVELASKQAWQRAMVRATNWKKDSTIHSTWNHMGYLRMHDHIYGVGHPIGQCLAAIAKGDISRLRQTYDEARRRLEKPSATIVEAFKMVGEKSKPEGRYNTNACENISTTARFIRECIELVESGVKTGETLERNEREFLDTLHLRLTESVATMERMRRTNVLDYLYCEAAVIVFKAVLRLYEESEPGYCIPALQQRLLIQLPMDRAFMPSMKAEEGSSRALCSAEDVMQAIDELLAESLLDIDQPMSEAVVQPILMEALRGHIEARRFLPAFALATAMRSPVKLDPPLIQQYQKAKADLTQELQDARQRVTHAMSLSALSQKKAGDLLRVIETLNASNVGDNIGRPEGASNAYPDFPHALATLRESVLQVLSARLEDTRDKLLLDLKTIEESQGSDASRDIARIRGMLETNNPANLRTAHDALAIIGSGRRLPVYALNMDRNPAVEYEAFLRQLDTVRGHQPLLELLEQHLADPNFAQHPLIRDLEEEGRQNAIKFIAEWRGIFAERAMIRTAELAGKFFSSVGIAAPTSFPDTSRSSRYTRIAFDEKAFSALISNDVFIPPALGTPTFTVMGYIIPGNQPDNDIPSLIHDIAGTPTFILARTRLTLSKRARLSGRTPVILVDDNLVAYMALNPDERARRLMEIGCLTFHTFPYSADGTSVPKEMFFGRQRELEQLRQIKSLAILYGGRRLGKSSLLNQVERDMSNIAGTVAIYIPMNRDYHGGDHVLFAWRTVARALAGRGVIDPLPVETQDLAGVRTWVEQQLTSAKQKIKNCYLLLDEADDLMGRELDLQPEAVSLIGSFHQMVESIQPKITIRYVIAGLHNLTRMTTESNSALGKAETIALEPFSTGDDILRGIQLVTRPLAALGFFFGKGCEDLPLRILALCNYYPAFIQVYCKKLLEHMYNKRPQDQACAYIEGNDLDTVEKDHDLLTELQTKFGWTLDLDKRYKAIALVLADIYYHEIESGKNEGLTVGEIREYCEMVAGNHFKGMSAGAYESLVDEMRKLNVLEKHGSNYRLRNPSIAMLIGDRKRINHQLKVLAEQPPEKLRNHGDRRVIMEQNGSRIIFPMPVAWTSAQMEPIDNNLVIMAGNNLSGLVDLCNSTSKWLLAQETWLRTMSLSPTTANSLLEKMRRQATTAAHKAERHLIASPSNAWHAIDIPAFANLMPKAASLRVRLALIALPERLYEIAQAMKAGSLAGANRKASWTVVPVPPWSLDAVRFHIHENADVVDSTEACSAIVQAGCGFSKPIRDICQNHLTHDSALDAVAQTRCTLTPDLATFYRQIGWPSAITADQQKAMEQFLLYANGEKRNSSEVDEYLETYGLAPEDLLFLHWMGLLQEGEDGGWHVPELYHELLCGSVS